AQTPPRRWPFHPSTLFHIFFPSRCKNSRPFAAHLLYRKRAAAVFAFRDGKPKLFCPKPYDFMTPASPP
ncbi:hypothetical protein, partial [Candidatus Allofournierella excrementavium]|uniref:hypothetical protein n=1 Tax=Candidatus Allofournierella excrementavium TaxID=2838591 RepID=UPI003AF16F47